MHGQPFVVRLAGQADHSGPGKLGELHGGRADAARRAGDDDGFAAVTATARTAAYVVVLAPTSAPA